MKARFALLLAALSLPCAINAAFAQDGDTPPARPMFVTLPPHMELAPAATPRAKTLVQWNGSFTDLNGKKINFTMVGTDPGTTNKASTVKVYIVPIKMVYGATNGKMTFDPVKRKVANGNTVVEDIIASPIFDGSLKFVQGGTDIGKTQYIDAFQRANFWSSVKTHTAYHVLLGSPTVLSEQTISVKLTQGQVMNNPFGAGKVGTMDINAFDARLQAFMKSFAQINPGVLPLFVTYDVYLTQDTICCIGGYHSANGIQPSGQTYSYATYEDVPGVFSQDVSALSHEIGEWVDDPFTDNAVQCKSDNNVLEVGDPIENDANYGDFPYKLNGSTYNLQSLVFITYFGDAPGTSVNSWFSFQNDKPKACKE